MIIFLLVILAIISLANYSVGEGQAKGLKLILSLTLAIILSLFMESMKENLWFTGTLQVIVYFALPIVSFASFQVLLYRDHIRDLQVEPKKQLVRNVILIVSIVLLCAFGFKQFTENKGYDRYLSHQLSNDVSRVGHNLNYNQKIYDKAINERKISINEAQMIIENHYNLIWTLQKYAQLGRELNKLDENVTAKTDENASVIESTFTRWMQDQTASATSDYQSLSLLTDIYKDLDIEADFVERIEIINELNKQWLKAFAKNVEGFEIVDGELLFDGELYWNTYKKNGISNKFWRELLKDFDVYTKDFLEENGYYQRKLSF
ncbi:MAG: hypothetical protein ACK4M9_22430 [Anaerobacillus sp.]|uniref:hypothetical protein n=1 Tax=Anaerobacillus sp. TaxID=1872506 RepID=UPI00391CC2F5